MNARRGPPVPFYRKLLLENKILLFFTFLLLIVGAAGLYAQQWATRYVAEGLIRERLEDALAPTLGPMGGAVASGDRARLTALLDRAAGLDPQIVRLDVVDAERRPLAAAPRGEATSRSDAPFVVAGLPLVAGDQQVGTLRVRVDGRDADRLSARAVSLVLAIMLVPVTLVLLTARAVVRQAVEPLKNLTRVADEISVGNLDPVIDFGLHVNCWEIKNCQRADCRAYMNFDQQCWYLDGTPCEGYEPRFPQKLQGCRTCEVYQAHRGDEIVQLADAFKHMTSVLKASREDVVKSGDFQKRLIRNSFNGIVATDAQGTVTIFNRAAEELLGVPRERVIGVKTWRDFFNPGLEHWMDQPLSHERVRRIRGFPPRESTIRRQDGDPVAVLLSGISLFERGIHIGRVFFFQDLREIKQLREDLIRSERLAATGQAAAGISHSIRNILDGLLGGIYVFKAGKRRGDEAKLDTGWEMIERNTGIIADLVRDLLNFAKARSPEYQHVEPAALIDSAVASLGERENRVTIAVKIDEAAGRVSLDPHAFHQCLVNLIRNAVEAIPAQGEGHVMVTFGVENGKAVFTVADDGVGMNTETLDKVKGGMFSTKGSKGTGLGLLVTQKIVGEHKGTLTIESEEGRGSTIRIELPANGEAAAA